jgi:hypothetical protein
LRETSEKELILCNLAARRQALLELGGFNEALYPNEENSLMDELQRRGGKLIYDPHLIVHRRPRSNLRSFARMLKTYGRGRAEQFRVNPTPGSMLNFAPPLFLVYLLCAPLLVVRFGMPTLAPLAAYGVCLLAQAGVLMRRAPVFASLAAIPLVALTHVLYGYGFWRGLGTQLNRRGPQDHSTNGGRVVVQTVER